MEAPKTDAGKKQDPDASERPESAAAIRFIPTANVQQSKQNEEHVKNQLNLDKPKEDLIEQKEDGAAEVIDTSSAPVIESHIVRAVKKLTNASRDEVFEQKTSDKKKATAPIFGLRS